MTFVKKYSAIVVSLFVALGCAEEPSSPTTSPDLGVVESPLCQAGCVETDSFPSAPGVFLGSANTPLACREATDTDGDELGDFCEKNLAAAFAPELYHWAYDNVGREPRWLAHFLPGTDDVRIGYLLSYYYDAGSSAFGCSIPPFHWTCAPHNGDSKAIFLDVYYDAATHHWVLKKALYSAHGGFTSFTKGTKAYPMSLLYPSHPGSYPRSYVSEGKHANYGSESACNSGGSFGSDTCDQVDTPTRVAAGASLNLGSRSIHSASQDCMVSSNPSYTWYGGGRQECYWTIKRFRGWVPDNIGGGDSQAYGEIIANHGF